MKSWIAFFRGINVGGHNVLKMADLREDLGSLQFENVRTYIQSGNVVFDAQGTASTIASRISEHIEERHGFRPRVLVLTQGDVVAAVQANPFRKAADDPKTLHFFFLEAAAANPNMDAIEAARHETERYKLEDRVFYLHAPNGIGRSKLAANAEKYLGVAATGRNYRTVDKVLSMAS